MMFYNYNPTDKENRPTMLWMAGLFMIIVWTSFEAPYTFVMGYKTLEHHLWWDVIFCTIFLIDIILKLKGALKLPQNSKLIEDKDKNLHELAYHRSLWFFIDIVTALPYDLIASAISNEDNYNLVAMVRLFRLFRVIKLRSVIGVIDFLPKTIKIFLAITGVMLAIHWIACGWMLLNPQPSLDPLTYYNVSLYWAVTTLTTVGYGDITPASNIARLYTMGVMLIGVASYGIIIGNFSRMIMLADRYNEERKEKLSNMNQFMRYYNIPMSLQREIFSFYNHLLNKKISDQDTQIVSDLPQALQNELHIYMKIKLIKK